MKHRRAADQLRLELLGRWSLCAALVACSAARAPSVPSAAPPLPESAAAVQDVEERGTDARTQAPSEAPPSAAELTELLLSQEGEREVVALLPADGCVGDDAGELIVEIRLGGQRHDTFTLPIEGSLAVCQEHGRGVTTGDFNFDGHEDLAVPVDNAGPYGGPTFAVLLFQPLNGHYQEAPQLSNLTREHLGLFQVDVQRRRLLVSGKSGCCLHYREELSVSGDVPSTIGSEVQSVSFANDKCTVLIERSGTLGSRSSKRPCTKDELP